MKALVLTGRILPGHDESLVWAKVAVLFKFDPETFSKRILSRLPLSIKESADDTELQRLGLALQKVGADVETIETEEKWFLQQGARISGPVPFAYLKNEHQIARLDGNVMVKQVAATEWTTLAEALVEPMFTLDFPPEPTYTAQDDEPPSTNKPHVVRSSANGNTLINCQACGRDISVLADKCPGCAAPNNWIHPSITKFMSIKDQTGVAQKFTFWSNKIELWGHTEKKLPWWMWIIFVLFVPIVTFNFVIAIIFIAIAFGATTAIFGRRKEFKANFQTGSWQSNDEAFWAPLRQKLRL